MNHPNIVSRNEWITARKRFLQKEKEFDRRRDELAAQRRELPCVKLDKDYVFVGPEGRVSLRDLFDGRRQLIVYHFMFDPSWEEGCKNCSLLADTFDGGSVHLPVRPGPGSLDQHVQLPRPDAAREEREGPAVHDELGTAP